MKALDQPFMINLYLILVIENTVVETKIPQALA
jgi:hypothetical protein